MRAYKFLVKSLFRILVLKEEIASVRILYGQCALDTEDSEWKNSVLI